MREGVSCAVAVILLLGTLSLGPLITPHAWDASAEPLENPGTPLRVDGIRLVTDYELWGDVVVGTTGTLKVMDGGRLVVDSLSLEGNAILSVAGGILEVSPAEGDEAYQLVSQHHIARGPDRFCRFAEPGGIGQRAV